MSPGFNTECVILVLNIFFIKRRKNGWMDEWINEWMSKCRRLKTSLFDSSLVLCYSQKSTMAPQWPTSLYNSLPWSGAEMWKWWAITSMIHLLSSRKRFSSVALKKLGEPLKERDSFWKQRLEAWRRFDTGKIPLLTLEDSVAAILY